MARKKIWIDVLTPKQALFANAMVDRSPKNMDIIITSRDYDELNTFLKQIDLKHVVFGHHGGQTLQGKLRASVERMEDLASFASKENFDLSFSFISPEAARVSFGLAIPHYIESDSPHATAACKLAVPLCKKLFSPFAIQKRRWMQYGIETSQVICYHALDPWAWLLSPNLPKRKRENLVVVRLEESFASYVKSGRGISRVVSELIDTIEGSFQDSKITIIARYQEQRDWAKKEFGNKCSVPETTVDGIELISRSSLVIGGGGTMTQEAALRGVPNISYFPSTELDVFENFYFPKDLSIKARTKAELLRYTQTLLEHADRKSLELERRAKQVTRTFEDPVKFIFKNL